MVMDSLYAAPVKVEASVEILNEAQLQHCSVATPVLISGQICRRNFAAWQVL